MPGRLFIGLSSSEKHSAEFEASALHDEPRVPVWPIVGAAVVALVVIVAGSLIHQRAARPHESLPERCLCEWSASRSRKQMPIARGWVECVPMAAWFVLAALAATLVIVAPFVTYRVKRSLGKV